MSGCRGAKIWLSDINEAAVREAASRIGGDARAAMLDVTDADDFKALVAEAVAVHGHRDVLFNNAGIGVVGFTNSVRVEAAEVGVRVCALCPGDIETPILDSDYPAGTPDVWRPDKRQYLTEIGGAPYPAEKFAD